MPRENTEAPGRDEEEGNRHAAFMPTAKSNNSSNGMMNERSTLEGDLEMLALKKISNPILKETILGIMAGWWVGIATLFAISLAGNIEEEVRAKSPIYSKLCYGVFFPFGLWLILLFGGELFTGNAMYMLVAFYGGRIKLRDLFMNWFIVFFSNAAGCIATVYFFGYLTNLFAEEPALSYVKYLAEYKIHQSPAVAFAKAIPANALVCTGIILGMQARDVMGKLANMWFPIAIFATIGFEHCIANLAAVPLGLMYGADGSVEGFIVNNLLAVVAGNIVGGGLLIGGAEFFLFRLSNEYANAVLKHQKGQREKGVSMKEAKDDAAYGHNSPHSLQGSADYAPRQPLAERLSGMTSEQIHKACRDIVATPYASLTLSRDLSYTEPEHRA